MTISTKGRLMLFALTLLVGACSGLKPKAPEVSVAGIELRELGASEQRIGIKLKLRNPNARDIPIEALSFDVELNGEHFARGNSDAAVTLPGSGEAMMDVSAITTLSVLLHQIGEMQGSGRELVPYVIRGQVSSAAVGGNVPFTSHGEFKLPRLPALRLRTRPPKTAPAPADAM